MFVVSIWMNSPLGFFRPPFSGTFTTVPSTIFRSACCTLAGHVARDADVWDFRASLSISSMYRCPATCGGVHVEISSLKKLIQKRLHVLAHVPSLRERRRVRHDDRHVHEIGERSREERFSAPVGPHSKTLDFSRRALESASAGGHDPLASNVSKSGLRAGFGLAAARFAVSARARSALAAHAPPPPPPPPRPRPANRDTTRRRRARAVFPLK